MDSEIVPIDPEVRAHIYSLVTALGGSGSDEAGRYVLGDDALACLRDLKRWMKLYDEKMNRLDVARCLGEANIVNGDLLPILAQWSPETSSKGTKARVALACLELLVPLTWPLELNKEMTVNHLRHAAYLQQAQLFYKRGVLMWDNADILRAVIRIALPSMTMSREERSSRDEGILKLVLYFLRNISLISQSPAQNTNGEENEVSRSVTIESFHAQDVFALILTICSNMGEDFNQEDVVVLEILFHLVKGVSVERLFARELAHTSQTTAELKTLLSKESTMNRDYARNAPSRHGRFGTMIWVKRDEAKVSTVSGQNILHDNRNTFLKMDQTKRWNKPKRKTQGREFSYHEFDKMVDLTSTASRHLRVFVEEFLDSGFNPLMTNIRKAIEREAERVLDIHHRQFFCVVAWFLEAERARRARRATDRKQNSATRDVGPDTYGLVASVLNQETFVALNRHMQVTFDMKEWQDLKASMRCFSQILLTVQEMASSEFDEDLEIADNIQSRIFYEETTHDRVITILKSYNEQGFGYLDACTELSQVFLKLLERYSKQNVDLQVRSRRKSQRKNAHEDRPNVDDTTVQSEAEDVAEAVRLSRERRFDFGRFTARFSNQKTVDTFLAFVKYYKDLNAIQLKRAHRFFYRVAFKQELTVLLLRIDIVGQFYKMIKGPDGLDPWNPMYKDWEELTRQVIRRLVKKLDQRPQIAVELLFSKINSSVYYLEYGQEKQTFSTNSRPAAEMEVKPDSAMSRESQIAIVIGALVMDDKIDLVSWIEERLSSAIRDCKARDLNEAAATADGMDQQASNQGSRQITIGSDVEAIRTALFKNGKLRLLLTLCGFEKPVNDVMGASWSMSPAFSVAELEATLVLVAKHREHPRTESGSFDPREQLRKKKVTNGAKSGPQPRFEDDSDGLDYPNGEFDFPDNVALAGSSTSVRLKPAGTVKRKRKDIDEGDKLGDDILADRRRKRELNALERRSKIKSDVYIRDSDEESDEEADKAFFAREEDRRKLQSRNHFAALKTTKKVEEPDSDGANVMRALELDDEPEPDDVLEIMRGPASEKPGDLSSVRLQRTISSISRSSGRNSEIGDWVECDPRSPEIDQPRLNNEHESEDEAPRRTVTRRRTGFIVDSDSD